MMWVQPAFAAEPTYRQLQQARDLYRQGVQLEAANDWTGALAKFQEVAAIKMTPQVRFHVARCQHKLGNLLEALGGYRLALHEAMSDPKAGDVQREAQAGIDDIEAKLPKVTITRGEGAEAASISLDGVALGESSIGKEVPVNPGVHTIEYSVPGGEKLQQTVTLKEGETKDVVLVIEGPKKPEPKPVVPDSEPATPAKPAAVKKNVLPWVALGVGGASLAASGVFYLMRGSAISDHDSTCRGDICPESLQGTGDNGKTFTTLGNVTLGLGVVGVGVGTVLLLTSNKKTEAPPPPRSAIAAPKVVNVVVGTSGQSAGATVLGVF